MIRLYGISNCDKIRKVKKIFQENAIDFEFIDYRKNGVPVDILKKAIKSLGMDLVFNRRGTTYRKLNIDYHQLSEQQNLEWLIREPAMIKRPLISKDDNEFTITADERELMTFLQTQ